MRLAKGNLGVFTRIAFEAGCMQEGSVIVEALTGTHDVHTYVCRYNSRTGAYCLPAALHLALQPQVQDCITNDQIGHL